MKGLALGFCSNGSKEDAAARLQEEEEMAQRIEERVRKRVAAALESEGVQKQIEARLREERAALEQKVKPCDSAVPKHVAAHRPVKLVCTHTHTHTHTPLDMTGEY